jgi:hypothetical protein
MPVEQRYGAFEQAKNYTKVYTLEPTDEFVVKQEDGYLGYASVGQLATTGSNIFEGGQIIDGNLTIVGDIYANNFVTSSTLLFTGSTNHGSLIGDIHTYTGSVFITGSESLKGDLIVSGNVYISGTTEFGGDLVPKTARGATLGTELRPFKGIFVSSGSINIASDIIGDPNTTLSNVGGNILVSAGGMRLIGDASFIATTGSFSYLSGSFTHIGNQFNVGDIVTTGSLFVSGSQTFIGNQTLSGSKNISGSLNVNGSIYKNGNKQFNYGQWASLYTQTGSANTAYAMKLETPTDGTSGFYVGNGVSGFPTRIYTEHTGLYNIQFSAQLNTTSNEAVDFSVWFAMTGSAIPYSNTDFSIEKVAGGGFQVAALNFLTPITSGSYVELYWSKTTANGRLEAKGIQSNPTRPATPSVIVTITQIA